jgi:transposase
MQLYFGGYMGYIHGLDRDQRVLFPDSLDDYIDEANPVRFLDVFVTGLDLKALGFTHTAPNKTGRPSYHPGDLLKLYIYGYLNKIRSSRKLEHESQRNIELMWLLRQLTPDFKTIADFRKENSHALTRVCREFTVLCKKLDLFGRELIAIDGSKFKAVNSKSRNFTEKKLQQLLQKINEKIDIYLKELDEQDTVEEQTTKPTAQGLKEKIDQLRTQQGQYQELLEKLHNSEDTQISLTDPDSRSMKTKQGIDVCYNVQIAVDHKQKLIVEHEVTNDVTDQDQLATMARRAKETLAAEQIEAVADMGYYNGDEVKKCLDTGIVPYIPKPNTSANSKLGLFGKEDFLYDAVKDCYRCPGEQDLTFRFATIEQGRHIRYYSTSACKTCLLKPQCTRNKENRRITRWVHEAIMEEMQQRVATNPEKVKARKSIVEHPFGTMKRWMDHGYFLTRGLEKVRGEMSLTILVYNVKRVLHIIGVKALIAAIC